MISYDTTVEQTCVRTSHQAKTRLQQYYRVVLVHIKRLFNLPCARLNDGRTAAAGQKHQQEQHHPQTAERVRMIEQKSWRELVSITWCIRVYSSILCILLFARQTSHHFIIFTLRVSARRDPSPSPGRAGKLSHFSLIIKSPLPQYPRGVCAIPRVL